MAIPSIAMIPSGYKANKVYSILPTDGSGDLDFARTSIATRVNENGLIETVSTGVPRLDYTDGSCPSLLLEPASTNLITQSEDFSSFTQNGCSVISDNISSVGGGLADKIQEDSLNTNKHIRPQSISITSGQSYIMSAWFKTDNCDVIAFREGSSSGDSIIYKFSTKTSSDFGTRWSNLKVVDYQNGWMRIEAKYTSTTTASMNFRVHLLGNDYNQVTNPNPSTYTYQGNGASGVYLWGLTVEQGSQATSYIPTAGTIISRTQDTASKSGISSLINSSEGVLYAEISREKGSTNSVAISINDGSTTNAISVYYFGADSLYVDIFNSSGTVTLSALSIDTSISNKIAVKYKSGDSALWLNGVEVSTDLGLISLVGLNEFSFDYGNTTLPFQGNCKDLRVFKTALTDAELETLTSYSSFNEMALAQNYIIQ